MKRKLTSIEKTHSHTSDETAPQVILTEQVDYL